MDRGIVLIPEKRVVAPPVQMRTSRGFSPVHRENHIPIADSGCNSGTPRENHGCMETAIDANQGEAAHYSRSAVHILAKRSPRRPGHQREMGRGNPCKKPPDDVSLFCEGLGPSRSRPKLLTKFL